MYTKFTGFFSIFLIIGFAGVTKTVTKTGGHNEQRISGPTQETIVQAAEIPMTRALPVNNENREEGKSRYPEAVRKLYLQGVAAYVNNNFEEAIRLWYQVAHQAPDYPNLELNLERARMKYTISRSNNTYAWAVR